MENDDEHLLANDGFDREGRIVEDLDIDGTFKSKDVNGDNDVFQRDLCNELLQEAYLIHDDDNDENVSNKSEYGFLLRWIFVFLAHWQFNLTDNALYFLLKILSVFSSNC